MNLALHGLLLQVFVSILNFEHGAFLCSAGEPGYLDFDNLPETNFSCQGKVIGGYYADVEAGCQMFHVCTIGQKDEIMDIKFLCLNGTVFDQETRVCERVDEVDCSKSERFYNLNLELYGNNAVTLSLHENTEEDEEDSLDDHQQRTTSVRPTTTTTTTTTTSRPNKPSSTPSSVPYSHPTGYPQHYQPQPPFPQVHTSQSKSLYDDKNGGYHHQYIFHNGDRSNSQATSYQLFSSQGVSSTTVQAPQVHQIRYSSTSSPQIIHNEPSTVTPLFHTSSTIQTLLNSNGNSPALINPIFHNHGIASTTEQFSIHSNNPRDTSDYRESGEQGIRPLEAVQSTNKGKISKLTISPVPSQESQRTVQAKTGQSSQQQRIPSGFLPTPATIETTIRSFYPTPRSSKSTTQSSGIQHIHVPPPVPIPQLKPHQITINLPPPDIQRIAQNPSPLLPSQSRVIVTAKASVSDESGRPLNSSQLVTLPLPTIPASYDDYKEGDESFDPFYRDVPKIRSHREKIEDVNDFVRRKRSLGRSRTASGPFVYDADRNSEENLRVLDIDEKQDDISDLRSIKESLMKFRKFLFNEERNDSTEEGRVSGGGKDARPLKDLAIGATRNLKARKLEDAEYEADDNDELEADSKESAPLDSMSDGKRAEAEESLGVTEGTRRKSRYRMVQSELDSDESQDEDIGMVGPKLSELENKRVLDVIILGTNEHVKTKSENLAEETSSTDAPVMSTSEEVTEPSVEETTTTTTVLPGKAEIEPVRKSSAKKGTEEEHLDQVTRQNNGGERREQKPGAKRISARIKSRGRTLRRKQHKNNSVERQKVERNETVESTSSLEGSIGKIDSHILKEADSQAPKDLGTRAVDERNRNAVKDSQESKSDISLKNKDDLDLKGYKEKEDVRVAEEHHEEQVESKDKDDAVPVKEEDSPAENHDKSSESSSIIPSNNEEDTMTEVPVELDEVETTKSSEVPNNETPEYKEEIAVEHREVVEDVETTIKKSSLEEDEETSSIHESKQSRQGKSMKFEESLSTEISSHREDKKLDDYDDEEVSKESSTTTTEAHKTSEGSSEFFTESSLETEEFNTEEEEPEAGSEEASTGSMEEEHSEEVSSSHESTTEETEDNSTQDEEEASTEGVLKFTDELPKLDHKEDSLESLDVPESTESISQDYVDDNYEPDNYKEREDSAESNELSYDKDSKDVSSDTEVKEDRSDYSESTTLSEEVSDEGGPGSEEDYDGTLEEQDSREVSEEESTILTTSSTTTTTMRPKLFKPIAARKNYNYIPPTTTPNPVVIKPRIPLLNPKPAKPLKSYNDLVPKPVIRKLPLLTRKYTTTTGSTTTKDDHQSDQKATTEVLTTTTENPRSDENVLESKLETKEQVELHTPKNETLNDQESSSSQEKSLSNAATSQDEESNKSTESFTPYPFVRISTLATTIVKMLEEAVTVPSVLEDPTTPKSYTLLDTSVINTTTATAITLAPEKPEVIETTTPEVVIEEPTSTVAALPPKSTEPPVTELPTSTLSTPVTSTTESEVHEDTTKPTKTMHLFHRKPLVTRRHSSFNCLEREMYRFYGDNRDCRLFHYCSPGFTSRQVLDFRFVCEEDTAFDEESQSCRHDVRKEKCPNRSW